MSYRIYALAKEYGMDNDQLMTLIADAGIEGKGSALASITEEEFEILSLSLLPTSSAATDADFAPTSFWRALELREPDIRIVELVKILESILNSSLQKEEKGSNMKLTHLIDKFAGELRPRFNVELIHKARDLRNKFIHRPNSTYPSKAELNLVTNALVLAIVDSLAKLPPDDRNKYVKQ